MLSDVSSEDVFAENISLEFLGITVISDETRHRVGDVQSTISGTLNNDKYPAYPLLSLQPKRSFSHRVDGGEREEREEQNNCTERNV